MEPSAYFHAAAALTGESVPGSDWIGDHLASQFVWTLWVRKILEPRIEHRFLDRRSTDSYSGFNPEGRGGKGKHESSRPRHVTCTRQSSFECLPVASDTEAEHLCRHPGIGHGSSEELHFQISVALIGPAHLL